MSDTATLAPEADHLEATPTTATQGQRLLSKTFIAFVITQALGAMNDNMFRWLIIGIGKAMMPDSTDAILTWGALLLFLPFMMFAAPAGFLADRFSKRDVMVGCKAVEILAMVGGIAVILSGDIWWMFAVLFVMATQSAFFGPSKYGCIPEMVRHDLISSANGIVAMTTMVAIIIGTFIGNYLSTWTIHEGYTPGLYQWWISATALIGVAVVGWLASLFITKLPAACPTRTLPIYRGPKTGSLRDFMLFLPVWRLLSALSIIPWAIGQTVLDIKELFVRRPVYLVALGSIYYWSLAVMCQLNIDKFGTEYLHVGQEYVGWLLGLLTIGIGVGAVLAGGASRGRIELGLVPIGAFFIAVFAIGLSFIPEPMLPAGMNELTNPFTTSFFMAAILLPLLGVAAGFYDIPLLAALQERSPANERGRILAAYNFLSFAGMSVASGLQFGLADPNVGLGLSASSIWLFAGLITLPIALVVSYFALLPLCRVLVRLISWALYRPRIIGLENIPEEGGVLLVSNHVTWIDGFLLYIACPRNIRYFAHDNYIHFPIAEKLSKDSNLISVLPGKRSLQALREARRGLKNGDLLCIFPEGGLSRSRQIIGFEAGFFTIFNGRRKENGVNGDNGDNGDSPDKKPPVLIPVYLGGLWGSIFSYSEGRFFKKWPRLLPDPVTIAFGKPIENPESPEQVRRIIAEMGVDVMSDASRHPRNPSKWITGEKETQTHEQSEEAEMDEHAPKMSRGKRMTPARTFLRSCRRGMRKLKLADSTGAETTGAQTLLRTLVLRRLLRREVLDADEKHVGVLLPPTVAGAVVNAALSIDRRVTVNLNYTFNSDLLNFCIKKAGIRHVLTSRKVMEKLDLELDAEIVYLDDLKEKVTLPDKLAAAVGAYATPVVLLERMLGLTQVDPNDILTIIFTSGSTGVPKGAMLSHYNISSNVHGFVDTLHIGPKDRVLGILPFFHAFGYTACMWASLMVRAAAVYHTNPLEPRPIGKIMKKYGVTIVPTTPTFLRTWMRRCDKSEWETVDLLATGAEKLPKDLADEFEKLFGVRPWEGYGTTETAPVVAFNCPPSRVAHHQPPGKIGSIGLPIPGIAVKIVDPETGEDLPADATGMLVVKGPNVMQGYYEQPEQTAEVIRDGWYTTGDIARIDDEGFIFLTGRQSRISKIGGEMVPHVLIEEAITRVLGRNGDLKDEGYSVAVAARLDPKKGERIVVLHTKTGLPPETICEALKEEGLPPLWIPSPKHFAEINAVPVLGTGKMDLYGIKQLAEEKFGE